MLQVLRADLAATSFTLVVLSAGSPWCIIKLGEESNMMPCARLGLHQEDGTAIHEAEARLRGRCITCN